MSLSILVCISVAGCLVTLAFLLSYKPIVAAVATEYRTVADTVPRAQITATETDTT